MIVLLWLAACAPPAISYRDDVFPLMQEHCTRCHGADEPEAGLDLYSTGLDGIVDRPALQSPLVLVAPGDSLRSYLFHKVNGTQSLAEGSGTQMPIGDPLHPDEIALLRTWIDDGAPW